MIKELISNREKYFWSKSLDGVIIIGGYNEGRFYGKIELTLEDKNIKMRIDVSNGISTSIGFPEQSFSNHTEEYIVLNELFVNFDEYLNNPKTTTNQEMNREVLMQNVKDLLPKYDKIK